MEEEGVEPDDDERDGGPDDPELERLIREGDADEREQKRQAALARLKAKRHEVEGCAFCERFKGQMHPSHDASDRCESGKYPHCTCGICFD